MKKFATGLSLICAVVLLAGIFLPWVRCPDPAGRLQTGSSISSSSILGSLSGWDVFRHSGILSALESMGGSPLQSDTHAFVVFAASIVMLLCALAAFVISLKSKGDNRWIVAFGIIISLAAVAAIGGLGWFLTDISSMDKWFNYIGYGIYVCGAGAVLGLIAGVSVTVTKGRKVKPVQARRSK